MLWIGDELIQIDSPYAAIRAWCEDINEHNRIVGGSAYYVSSSSSRGMGWMRDGLQSPVEIGWPAGHYSNMLTALNNAGEAVGYAYTSSGSFESSRWIDGVFTTVPGAGILEEIARDGTAIGTIDHAFPNLREPTVSLGAQAWQLQQLLDPVTGVGWDLINAAGLNDAGAIVCNAYDPTGKWTACMLTPVAGVRASGIAARKRTSLQIAEIERTLGQQSTACEPRR